MDFTDSIFDFLSQISNSIQEEFDEILSRDSKKKEICQGIVKNIGIIM